MTQLSDIKFGRKYKLIADVLNNEQVIIELPYTLEFDCKRDNLASVNTGNFKIYNLAPKTRDLIFKDKYDVLNVRYIEFQAGYNVEDLPSVFKGNILQAKSYRNGVDIITEIEAYDGGYAVNTGYSIMSIVEGQVPEKTISDLMDNLPGISGKIIGNFTDLIAVNKRGKVLFGPTSECLAQETGNRFYIDNMEAKALNDNEVEEGDVSVINADTGLLESPQRSEAQIVFKMLFEPKLKVGQRLELQSKVNAILNGQYKVMGFQHSGIISDAVSGTCSTNVNLWLGTESLQLIQGIIQGT